MGEQWRNRIVGLEEYRPGEIADHPRQWRTHDNYQASALRGVLAEVGIADALLVYVSDGSLFPELEGQLTAIDGHLRKGLDQKAAWPCLVLDVTDEEAMKLLATHDPLAALAGSDAEALGKLLAQVSTEDAAIQRLLDEIAAEAGLALGPELPEDPGAQIDRAEELQEKWGTALGQVWELGEHRLAVGDCTDKAVVEAVMRGERARLCLTDPPYNYDMGYDVVDDALSFEEYEAFTRRWWELARRYAACVLVTPGLKNLDFYYRNFDVTWTCAWIKKNAMTASPIGPLSVWEPIVYQADEWDWEPVIVAGKPRKRVKRDVYEFPIKVQEGVGNHPCPKLLEFWERLLLDFSRPGDVILDIFVGTGTSVIGCERRKRVCRAIELSPEYCAVAIQRWVDMTGLEPRLAS